MQRYDLYASRQRIRQLRNKKNVGGACKQEMSRRPPAVQGYLDLLEQFGNTVDFVKYDALGQGCDETRRIGPGAVSRDEIVKAEIAVVPIFLGVSPSKPSDTGPGQVVAIAQVR